MREAEETAEEEEEEDENIQQYEIQTHQKISADNENNLDHQGICAMSTLFPSFVVCHVVGLRANHRDQNTCETMIGLPYVHRD